MQYLKSVSKKRNGEYSPRVKSTVGVKQGGQLSPVKFLHYIDDLLEILENSGLLITIKHICVGRIGYADDSNIIAKSIEKVNKALQLVVEYCFKNYIVINQAKTEWMKLGEPVPTNGSVKTPLTHEIVLINNITYASKK